ncbi:M1 family metallopeptidase [Arundinibacter roseus]|uniref:Aminopeptidase N n=1 Tax=Arundinibacter roseus TaxID=2070510 RepID=A0A4R4KN05_9BACT|nr:M1 family metallopeptidase [Arundinibacter roseus]TDB67921.1 peptidase M1 [Arundinibacter roseus]
MTSFLTSTKIKSVTCLLFVCLTTAAQATTPFPSEFPADTVRRVEGSVSTQGPYRPARTLKNDILHTKLNLRFDWLRQHVLGTAVLTFKPYFYPQNRLELDAKGFDIQAIYQIDTLVRYDSLTNQTIREPIQDVLEYTYDRRKLNIQLRRAYTRKETLYVQIDYVAKPNELPRGEPDDHPNDKGLYFINADGLDEGKPRQIWTQGETESNSCWFPTVDSPNEKFIHDFYITVDSTFKTLSNGLMIGSVDNGDGSRTDHWKQSLPHAPYLAMLAVGDFAVTREMMPNGLELSYYVEPKYAADAKAIFGRTPEMIAFFSNIFGVEFPWEKYAQISVRDFVAGAMENTTATIHEEGVQADTRTLVDGNSDAVIAHELAHHWFGNLVTCEEWGQLPLNESFANYSEYLWAEYYSGKDEADWQNLQELKQYLGEADQKMVPMIRYFYKDREDMFDSHSYSKGGRILHMLRNYVGDDAFFLALKNYLKEHRFATAEINDLRMAFEKVTGEDLNWFFDQWFMQRGHPVLKVEQEFSAANQKVRLKISQLQDTLATTVYRLPLKVDIWVDSIKTRYDVVINKARQTLEFPAKYRPDLVIFDAESQLLGTIDHPKSRQEAIFQFYNASTFLSKYEAMTQLEGKLIDSTTRHLMLTAMTDPFWKIRQMAVSNFAEYDGLEFVEAERAIQSRARIDPNSQVRAEAILTLASFGDNSNDPLFREALNDTSYLVVSVALDSYLIGKPGDANDIAARFENSPNDAIVAAVGNYYASIASPDRYEWFLEKMDKMNPSDRYNFLQVFGKYLIKSPSEIQRRSIPVLESLARNSPSYFVRFGAYQVLGLLTDIQGVTSIRKDIRSNERDPKLKEMYSQFGEF